MLPPHEPLREQLHHTALASAAERCLGSAGSYFALHRIKRHAGERADPRNRVYVKPDMPGRQTTLGRTPAVARTRGQAQRRAKLGNQRHELHAAQLQWRRQLLQGLPQTTAAKLLPVYKHGVCRKYACAFAYIQTTCPCLAVSCTCSSAGHMLQTPALRTAKQLDIVPGRRLCVTGDCIRIHQSFGLLLGRRCLGLGPRLHHVQEHLGLQVLRRQCRRTLHLRGGWCVPVLALTCCCGAGNERRAAMRCTP